MFISTKVSSWRRGAYCFLAAAILLSSVSGVRGQHKSIDLLRIGASSELSAQAGPGKEEAALETLRAFIKDETGFNNEIIKEKDWQVLTDKLASGALHLGVFQGFEFAWAAEKHPQLKPLALAINVYRYPVIHVVANKSNPAKDFAGLKGQTLAVPTNSQAVTGLFVNQQAQAAGSEADAFFSKIIRAKNVEDAVDDVVDGVVQVVAVDRAALEAFKRRKPARFANLKEIVHSAPFPPVVVAYYDKVVDGQTLNRFRKGMLEAGSREKGQMMLNFFRLTGFEVPPEDFAKVLADTRKALPAPSAKK
jgi:ABC-type phosphate/phosphonate transport system substrate-binding protein